MSDFNSSLPVRTESAGDVVAKLADATTPSQQLSIDSSGRITDKLNDGSGNPITSQASGGQRALDVGIDVAGVQVDPRSIRALTSSDVVTANQGSANTAANGWPVKPTDGTNSQSFTASGEAKVDLTVVSGSAITLGQKTSANSFPVVIASDQSTIPVSISGPAGTEVNDYKTVSALAANASDNHDYAITASKTFKGRLFWASSSGKIKAEVQISPDGSTFTSKWVGFNSTATPNISIALDNLTVSESGTGAKIRIIVTNRDNQAEDVYSTISGTES